MDKKIIATIAVAAIVLLLLKKKQPDEVALRADTPAFGTKSTEIYYDKYSRPMISRRYA